MNLSVLDVNGKNIEEIEVDESVFGIALHDAAEHQVLTAQLAARRSGTHSSKTRGEVRGSTRKIYGQKGRGMARAGASRSPTRRGGGVVFGPKPRDYSQKIPKGIRRLAIKSVLSRRVHENKLLVVSDLGLTDGPSTSHIAGMLSNLGVDKSVLIVTGNPDSIAHRSARNIEGVDLTHADTLSVVEMRKRQNLILTVDAIRRCEALWGKTVIGSADTLDVEVNEAGEE
jgi:large subunit ribosomal protein L4